MTRLPALLPLAALAAFLIGTASAADKKSRLQEQQGELRGRIETLQRDLARNEESRSAAAERLREAESAISAVNRGLHELAANRQALERELAAVDEQRQRLDRQTQAQQTQLGRLLHSQFVGGDSDAMQLLLSGRDPNQGARDRYFLTQLSRAKADLIGELRGVAAEKRKLAEAVKERQAQLADIEKRQQESRAQLLEKQKQRQTALAALASEISSQRREIGALKRDEQRLSSLVAGLAKRSAERKPTKLGAGEAAPGVRTPAPPSARLPVKNADPGAIGDFGALRGKLRLPVAGHIAARFGAPRAEGGTHWRGLLIRADEGTEVRVVAAGTVVYSDWLRGFGNLLIVDHGDDFLSIYGNNQSLLRSAGQTVKGGDAVATVGSSGGNAESGLYFELRHRGQAFDPLKWARH